MALALQLSAGLLGAAGMAHCAAMCSLPCAMAARACAARGASASSAWEQAALHAGRLTGYMLLGVAAAASAGFLRGYFDQVLALRPLWLLLQLALLLGGVAVLVTGRLPGIAGWSSLPPKTPRPRAASHRLPGPVLALPAGLAWALLPCAQLYAGVALASMADGAADAAGVMLAFGLPGTVAVLAGPAGWRAVRQVLRSRAGRHEDGTHPILVVARRHGAGSSWSVRLAGASTAIAAAWLLLHSVKPVAASWCG